MSNPIFELDKNVVDATLTKWGFSIGFFGFVHEAHQRVEGGEFFLCNKALRLAACRKSVTNALFDPARAGRLTAGYVQHLDGGFFVSLDFNSEVLTGGKYWIEAELTWTDQKKTTLRLIWVNLVDNLNTCTLPAASVAIAMATYNPNIQLFERQIMSLQQQEYQDWICLISDDCSDPRIISSMKEIVGQDKRFQIVNNSSQVGFYRNFERALAFLPSHSKYVAMCDQDDFWRPNKISKSIECLEKFGYDCVYSDCVLVSNNGIRQGFLSRYRCLRFNGLWSLLSANVATGMTMLMSMDVLEKCLPFPVSLGNIYHDHWIALVASRMKGLGLVDEALVEYTQHGANHTGATTPHQSAISILRDNICLLRDIAYAPLRKDSYDANILTLRRFNDSYRSQRVNIEIMLNASASRVGAQLNREYNWGAVVFRLILAGLASRDRYRRGIVVNITCKAVIEKILRSYIKAKK